MSLEHLSQSATLRDGAYLVMRRPDGKIVLLQLPDEDLSKSEGDLYFDSELTILSSGLLGSISGGVKPGESAADAVVREAKWEADLIIKPADLRPVALLPTHTIQQRHGNLVHIVGTGFDYQVEDGALDELELMGHRQNRRVEVTSPIEVIMNPQQYPLRPFMASVVRGLISEV